MCFVNISWQEFIDLVKVLTPIIVVVFPLAIFRKQISSLLSELRFRLKTSNRISFVSKIASIEMDRTRVGPSGTYEGCKADDVDGLREKHRTSLYKDSRGLQLVHTLSKSSADQQLFDIEIFIVPHKEASVKGLSKVSYFFGSYWSNKSFETSNRFNGFLVSTSAYGSFLCTAELTFTDGTSTLLSRYIDFEMGDFAPVSLIEHKTEKSGKKAKI